MKRAFYGFFIAGVLFAGLADAADDWTQLFPDPYPSARRYHKLAYIGGDHVLLFGGNDGANIDETWVYDLSENTWSQQTPSSKPSARWWHAMAYIGGDQLLLFGGWDASNNNDETWIYDLSENTWTQKSPSTKPSARRAHAMAYIGENQALLFGGYDGSYDNETWVYDPASNTWTRQNPLSKPSPRTEHAMVYLGGDQVLLFGGKDSGGFENDETWIYDLSENSWTQKYPASKPSARHSHGMAYIGWDQALLFGGYAGAYDDETWVYDLSENTWIQDFNTAQPTPRLRFGLCETSVERSSFPVLFGGGDGFFEDDTWIFGGGDYPIGHEPQVTVMYPNGDEVLTDSVTVTWAATDPDSGETALLSVDLDYSANGGGSWTPITSGETNDGAYFWDISGLVDGSEYLVRVTVTDTSGLPDSDNSDAVFMIDNDPDPPQVSVTYPNGGETLSLSATITWTATDPDPGDSTLLVVDLDYSDNGGGSWTPITSGEANDGAYLWDSSGLPDGDNYLVRVTVTDTTGRSDSDVSDAVFSIFKIADDWTQHFPDPHPSARRYHKLAYIGGDKVLLFGGFDGVDNDDETWVYDLSENTWSQQTPSSKPSARWFHAMAYIGGDQLLLFGGWDSSNNNDETWIYDLSENTWTQKSPSTKPSARRAHAMAYIGENQVLLFGGYDGSYDNETWIYNLAAETWTQQTPLSRPSPRVECPIVYIGGDQVLLFGGNDGDLDDETWVYDLSENTWTQQSPASKPSARYSHAMAYIGGGQVLLFGGDNGVANDETWVYDLSENDWIQDFNTTQPSPRVRFGLCETSMKGSSFPVLFGGDDGLYKDDTWIFGGGDYPMGHAPQVAVTYPNGGETLTGSVTITWTATDPDSGDSTLLLVDLDYSDNAGSSWSVIDSGQPNNGTYFWDISGLSDGKNYLVRTNVTDTIGLSDSDISDAVFTIDNHNPDPPQVTVTCPNGGEILMDSVTITWTATDPDPGETALLLADLDYSANAGAMWSVIDLGQPNDGTYFWDISGLSDGDSNLVRVTVTDTTGLFDSDSSDAAFIINNAGAPQVTVTYPNGGEIFADLVTITWTATDPDPGETALLLADLDYSANAGATWSVIDSSQPNNGSYFWDISALSDGDTYLVRVTVTDTNGLSNFDVSDDVFVITSYANNWTQQFPDPHPSARGYHDQAYIGGDQVLLFGGFDGSSVFADTWVYDLSENSWTQKFPDPHPSWRNRFGLAYIGGDQVLLFGGYDGTYENDETWVYDLSENSWTQISPSPIPATRYGQEMAYIGGDQVLLFGGWDGAHKDETWVYDLSDSAWTQMSPPVKPAAREYFGMAYIGGDQVLLFGGWWYFGDTWVYDLSENSWTQMSPPAKPSARHWHGMDYIGGDRVLLFGGNDGSPDDETWVYDLSERAWTQVSPQIKPSARDYHDMAYIGMDRVLLFGGYDGSFNDETWIYYMTATLIAATSAARVPEDFFLSPNYPNPFNPLTEIAYTIPRDARVTLKVYNVLGAEVGTLVDAHHKAGSYTVRWDAAHLASGVYFCTIHADDFKATKKMVLLK